MQSAWHLEDRARKSGNFRIKPQKVGNSKKCARDDLKRFEARVITTII